MRLCYLHMTLLTSAIAARAVTDTAKTNIELTASRAASSPTSFRDDLAAPAITETQRADDEDRGWMPVPQFAALLGKDPYCKAVKGLKGHGFDNYVEKGITPKAVYDILDLSNPHYVSLSHIRWIDWIFLHFQLGRFFGENEYEFIIAAMSVTYGPEALSDKLLCAVQNKQTKPFAMKLIDVASKHIKSRVFKKLPQLERELPLQKQHSAGSNDETPRGRIDAYLKKHVTYKRLDKRKFHILTSYLSVLFNKDHAVGSEQNAANKSYKDAALLDRLLSLDNFQHQVFIESLASIYLEVNVPPSKIVSMLVQDVPEADQFTTLFSKSSSRSFWLHYLERYSERNHKKELTHIDFEQLLRMLNGIEMETKEPNSALSDTAISTWLKVLTAPHIKHLQTSQNFRDKIMSMWRDGGILPSKIVSALMLDEAKEKCFTILFLNEVARSFWERYFEQFIQINSNNAEMMQSATTDFERLVKTLFAVAKQKSLAAKKYVAYTSILKMLISPNSAHLSSSHEHAIELISILWLDRTLPSKVLSMLMHGEAEADKFKILFVNKLSKSFWVRYLKLYFKYSFDVEDFASTARTEFHKLLIMLHAVGVQEVAKVDKHMVSSTILKILVAPEIATIVDFRYLEKMVLTWLKKRIPPSDVVSMLVLEEEETDYFKILFTNTPSSTLWEDYTTSFHADASPQQKHMMSTLIDAFGDENLERIFTAALTVEATSKKAKSLLDQFEWQEHEPPFSNGISQMHRSKKNLS